MRRRKSGRNLRRSGRRSCEFGSDFFLKIEKITYSLAQKPLEVLIVVLFSITKYTPSYISAYFNCSST